MAKPTILVVDDERLIRWSLTKRLKADVGHKTRIQNLSEALKIVRSSCRQSAKLTSICQYHFFSFFSR